MVWLLYIRASNVMSWNPSFLAVLLCWSNASILSRTLPMQTSLEHHTRIMSETWCPAFLSQKTQRGRPSTNCHRTKALCHFCRESVKDAGFPKIHLSTRVQLASTCRRTPAHEHHKVLRFAQQRSANRWYRWSGFAAPRLWVDKHRDYRDFAEAL